MEGIKVQLEPNVDKDYQAFTFEDLGTTYEAWIRLSSEEKNDLIYECQTENICSIVESIEEY